MALATTFCRACSRRRAVAGNARRIRIDARHECEAPLAVRRPMTIGHAMEQVAHIDRLRLQPFAAAFEPGEIQQIPNDGFENDGFENDELENDGFELVRFPFDDRR